MATPHSGQPSQLHPPEEEGTQQPTDHSPTRQISLSTTWSEGGDDQNLEVTQYEQIHGHAYHSELQGRVRGTPLSELTFEQLNIPTKPQIPSRMMPIFNRPTDFTILSVFGTSDTMIPEMSIHQALKTVWDTGYRWTMIGGWRYQISMPMSRATIQMTQRAQWPQPIEPRGTARDWIEDAVTLDTMESSHELGIFGGIPTTTTHATSSKPIQGESSLHAHGTRQWWKWHEGNTIAHRAIRPKAPIMIHEQPTCATAIDAAEMIRTAGWPTEADGADYGGPTRCRDYFTSPQIFAAANTKQNRSHLLPEGTELWQRLTTHQPTLKSLWPKLLQTHFSSMSIPMEESKWDRLQIRDTQTGEILYAGMKEVAYWTGLHRQLVTELAAEYPCYKWCYDDTGEEYKPTWRGHRQFHECQVVRTCLMCDTAVTEIGKTWNLPTVQAVATAVFHEASVALTGDRYDLLWQHTAGPHHCHANCRDQEHISGPTPKRHKSAEEDSTR